MPTPESPAAAVTSRSQTGPIHRTKAYNASPSGSATNVAHIRGFAVDIPPPSDISLDQHKQHVLPAFECGAGYYAMGRGYFVHADSTTRSAADGSGMADVTVDPFKFDASRV